MSPKKSPSASDGSAENVDADAIRTNRETLEALQRLAKALSDLDDRTPNVRADAAGESSPTADDQQQHNPNFVSHWRLTAQTRHLPMEVRDGYKMLSEGAELVKATSTKYTLVGKISLSDGTNLVQELRQGCELLATGALILCSPPAGCSRSSRHYVKRSARSVVATVLNLITVFVSTEIDLHSKECENLAAQKTGAVWTACDNCTMKLPKGNRNAMRRDLMIWAGECNETYTEFEELIGTAADVDDEDDNDKEGQEGNDPWDEFGGGAGHQYSAVDLPVATACLALIKCSRGSINATIKACECAGDEVARCQDSEREGNCDDDDAVAARAQAVLNWIGTLHDQTRLVGEGVTDLGCLLYPPLKREALMEQVTKQRDAILAVNEAILDAVPTNHATQQQTDLSIIPMSEEVLELASKLRTAANKRFAEAEAAVKGAS